MGLLGACALTAVLLGGCDGSPEAAPDGGGDAAPPEDTWTSEGGDGGAPDGVAAVDGSDAGRGDATRPEDGASAPDGGAGPDDGAADDLAPDGAPTEGMADAPAADDGEGAGADASDVGSDAPDVVADAGPDGAPADASDGTAPDLPPDAGDGPDGGETDGAPVPPSETGPHALATSEGQVERDGRTTPVVAHHPAEGTSYPLLVFVPGFQLESSRYTQLAEHVASHGFVVVRADPPDPALSPNHVAMAADVSAVIDWAIQDGGALDGLVDGEAIATTGHSLGGKVATMAAHDDDRVTALVALDPVNGGSPLSGYTAELPDIVPDRVAPLEIPVGFAGETLDGTASGLGGMACAPTDQNYQTFYEAASNAPWAAQWTFEGADHMDFVDDTSGCGLVCSSCQDGSADEAAVRAATHTLVAAFARRHLRGEASMAAWLTGPNVPALVATQTK